MSRTVNLGTKFQVFEGNKRMVYRALRYEDAEQTLVTMIECDTGKLKTYTVDQVLDLMVTLEPDAILNLMITAYADGGNDVYAWVYRADSILAGVTEPVIILRQDIYSYLKNPLAMDGKIYVGDCLTQYTMPNGEKLMAVNDFDHVEFDHAIRLYVDDTLDDIFSIIPKSVQKKFNKVLEKLTKRLENKLIVGYCHTLRELFEDNKFIDAYRSIFNITQVDFPIILGKESYNKDGDLILNHRQVKRIEDMLRKNITDIRVIKYDYDIDIKEIVSFDHILVSDSTQEIFLIAYTTISDYPVDEDIAKAMGV